MSGRPLSMRGRDLAGRSSVGAIVEFGSQSFVVADVKHWGGEDYQGVTIEHERLAAYLGVTELRGLPASDRAKGPALVRFPMWMFCVACRVLKRRDGEFPTDDEPRCPSCGGVLVGMRWVGACKRGHLFDIPWDRWAHADRDKVPGADPPCRQRADLRLRTRRGQSVDQSLYIECITCRRSSSLARVESPEGLAILGLTSCPGTQPWYGRNRDYCCDQTPVILLRASSRIHFPQIMSMIEIPPEADQPLTEVDIAELRSVAGQLVFSAWLDQRRDGEPLFRVEKIASQLGITPAVIEEMIDREIGRVAVPAIDRDGTIRAEDAKDSHQELLREWVALCTPRPDRPAWSRFVTEHHDVSALGQPFSNLFDRLVLVERLREVRAYYGYRRIDTNDPEGLQGASRRRADGGLSTPWLPAHEVMGEGIFLNLSDDRVKAWSSDPRVAQRIQTLSDRFGASTLSRGRQAATVSHRDFPLLHSIAHLLIRELAFSAGYSATSLRERIYVGETSSGRTARGILIYTAEGDSEGTLGGLVRAGSPSRLAQTLASMTARAEWCGQDPVCRESQGQGYLALNLAACHGCSLLSETSCVHQNVLLDRMLAVSAGPECRGYLVA